MTIQELKDRIYQDFISSFTNAITPLKASFFDQLSNTLAGTFQLIYIYLNNIYKDSFLSTCTEDRVRNYYAPLKNIDADEATTSTGTVRFTGTDGAIVESGWTLTYSEMEYTTSESGIIEDGYVDILCESVETGTITNTLGDITLTLATVEDGIDPTAICYDGFSGAIDDETIESLRTRTKQKFASPTNIDSYNFYRSLAMEVDNVKAAFISRVKNGNGTFGVTILTKSNNGVPVQADIDEVEEYFIENNAVPEYVEAQYFLPTIVYQDLSILLADNSIDNQDFVEQAIKDYVYLYQKPGTTFQFSELSDYMQTIGARLNNPDPTSDLEIAIDEVLDIGTITWI